MLIPFSAQSKTLKVAVTQTASTSTALPSTGDTIRVVNAGANIAYFSVGTGTQTATVPATSSPVATCTPILPGEDAVFGIPRVQEQPSTPNTAVTPLNFSAIADTGLTTTLYVSTGEGV